MTKQTELLPSPLATGEKKMVEHQNTAGLFLDAVQAGAKGEDLQAIIDAVRFADSREAERAFNSAFTKMQAELPIVKKTRQAHNSMYAPYDEVVAAVRPVLVAHGFSFRHEIDEDDASMRVTCIVAHEGGHAERATRKGVPDTSGSKNTIQAGGSTQSYLQRYSLTACLGIACSDDPDNDGGAPVETITEEQAIALKQAFASVDDGEKKKKRLLDAHRVRKLHELPLALHPDGTTLYDRAMAKLDGKS